MTIAAAFTAGDSDQLMVGRNGVFYDRQGRDWDATITKIIDHPSAFARLSDTLQEADPPDCRASAKLAAAKAKASDDLDPAGSDQSGRQGRHRAGSPAAGTPPPAPPALFDAAKFAGIFAAVGLAIGAIGTALAPVVTGFLGLKVLANAAGPDWTDRADFRPGHGLGFLQAA